MERILKWIIVVVLFVGMIFGASLLYDKLSEEYDNQGIDNSTVQNSEDYAAPDFTVIDYDGYEVNLSDFKGKPVVINFWATWCHYCKKEMPDFNKAYKKYPEVQFLMVNATDGERETVKKAKEYIEKEKFDFDVFFDVDLDAVNKYYITGFPTTVFIDKEGRIVTGRSGMMDIESLEETIKSMIEN